MIRIAEDDLRPELLQQMLRYGLHRTYRTYRHEHRRLHLLVRQVEHRSAAPAMRDGAGARTDVEAKTHPLILEGTHFEHLAIILRQVIEQLLYGAAQQRMPPLRSNLRERRKHKPPLVHRGMGQR